MNEAIKSELARLDQQEANVRKIIPTNANWETVRGITLARIRERRRTLAAAMEKIQEAERAAAEMTDADRFDFALQ
jgi:hypothetical protein